MYEFNKFTAVTYLNITPVYTFTIKYFNFFISAGYPSHAINRYPEHMIFYRSWTFQ